MSGKDLFFQPVTANKLRGLKCVEFSSDGTSVAEGFISLILRWLKTLLTPIGSDLLNPTYGTDLASAIGSNISSVASDVQDLILLSVSDANAQVKAQDLENSATEEEALLDAVVIRSESSADSVAIWIRITNIAGSTMNVPLSTAGV